MLFDVSNLHVLLSFFFSFDSMRSFIINHNFFKFLIQLLGEQKLEIEEEEHLNLLEGLNLWQIIQSMKIAIKML